MINELLMLFMLFIFILGLALNPFEMRVANKVVDSIKQVTTRDLYKVNRIVFTSPTLLMRALVSLVSSY